MNSRTLARACLAALLASTIPAGAVSAAPPPPVTAAHALTAPVAGAVERFYQSRGDAPLWFANGPNNPAALQLLTILRRSELDGVAAGPQLAAEVEGALQRAQSGNPADIAQAERLMSSAWVLYAQALNWPSASIEYGDQYLAPRIPQPETILYQAAQARPLRQHLVSVAQVNPLYEQLREAAWSELRSSGDSKNVRKLRANMDRAKALPATGRFILVDVASAQLHMYENGRIADSMKVIVGKPEMATPLIASTIHYATFNPYWHVPPGMVRRIIAPNVLRRGQSYLDSRGYQLVSGYTDDAEVLPASSIDWKAVADGRSQVWVRQLPGKGNSMGSMKFSFPNETGIYLHDTPQKELFSKSQRTLSGGCIRLEDAPRLAHWLTGGRSSAPSRDPELHVKLPEGVPIYVTYLTALPSAGQITFTSDVYGLDLKAEGRLASR